MSEQPSKANSIKAPLMLIVTVVLCLPAIKQLLAGQLPVSSAALRCGLAVLVSWAGIAGISSMVDGYRRNNADPRRRRPPADDR